MTYTPQGKDAAAMIEMLLHLADCLCEQVTYIQTGWLDAEKQDVASAYRAVRNYRDEAGLRQAIAAAYAVIEEWGLVRGRIEQLKRDGIAPKVRKGK